MIFCQVMVGIFYHFSSIFFNLKRFIDIYSIKYQIDISKSASDFNYFSIESVPFRFIDASV